MATGHVEEFYRVHRDLIDYLIQNNQPSFASEANDNFRRSLVLAIASYFEHEISNIVRDLPVHHAGSHPMLLAIIEQKAVARQYHSYFDWDSPNANKFFSLFGSEYKAMASRKVTDDPDFKRAVAAFLALGVTRNRLVHQNYVQFDVDKTPEDIIGLYRDALAFLDFIKATLLPPRLAEASEATSQPI